MRGREGHPRGAMRTTSTAAKPGAGRGETAVELVERRLPAHGPAGSLGPRLRGAQADLGDSPAMSGRTEHISRLLDHPGGVRTSEARVTRDGVRSERRNARAAPVRRRLERPSGAAARGYTRAQTGAFSRRTLRLFFASAGLLEQDASSLRRIARWSKRPAGAFVFIPQQIAAPATIEAPHLSARSTAPIPIVFGVRSDLESTPNEKLELDLEHHASWGPLADELRRLARERATSLERALRGQADVREYSVCAQHAPSRDRPARRA